MQNKGKISSALLILLTAAVLNSGCSIKEDRNICPCMLVLDFSNVPDNIIGMSEVYIRTGDITLYSDPEAGTGLSPDRTPENAERLYGTRIPKSMIGLTVVCGTENHYHPSSGILIPFGEECPPVWMHYSEEDATGERCDRTVDLHKDYCEIRIRMLPSSSAEYPFGLTVKGNVCGIYPDRTVMPGDFSYSFVPEQDGAGTVRVPRQTDRSLVLQVWDEERVLREFALGEYIEESGYDWAEENLKDMELQIDYANSYVSIDVAGWSDSFEFDIVI